MKKKISAKQKTIGRPATGVTPMMGFRAEPATRAAVVRWAAMQPDMPTLSEAIRRLVELGLTLKTKGHQSKEGQKKRAHEMAGTAIDNMMDTATSPNDQASRKRRLLKGPEEFRNVRVDRPKR